MMRIAFPPWIGLPIAAPAVAIAWQCPDDAKSFAASGSLIAVLGVLTLGRPIFRLGYREWFRASQTMDGGEFEPTSTQLAEEMQQALDAKALQLWGPLLVSAGTLMNGFSSYIP